MIKNKILNKLKENSSSTCIFYFDIGSKIKLNLNKHS
jgi:hypothetical protein